jgi:tetratricopeptide (TPR) repeat protein
MDDLERARALRRAGDHTQAHELLIALAEARPDDAVIQYEAACVCDVLGLEAAAVPYYLRAIHGGLTGEDLRGAYLGLGSTYRALGRYPDAAETLEGGLRAFPYAAELRVFLAMARYNLGQPHAAMGLLLEVLADTSGDPSIQGYARAIRLYAQDLDRVWEG